VLYAQKNRLRLKDISIAKLKSFSKKFEEDVYEKLKVENIVSSKNSKGGTSGKNVKEQLNELDKTLKTL